jgi:hypothetical protein
MTQEYRRTKKIKQIDEEGNWHPMLFGLGLLENLVLSNLPTTNEEVDEDNKKKERAASAKAASQ